MATSERLAAEIPAGTGLNGHCKELSGMVLGKQRLSAGGSRNLLIRPELDQCQRLSGPSTMQGDHNAIKR